MTSYQTSSLEHELSSGAGILPASQTWSRWLLAPISWEGMLAIVLLLAAWQYASINSTPMFFPPLQKIYASGVKMLTSAEAMTAISVTYLRILASLLLSFMLALILGVAAAAFRPFERFIVPLIELKQGIPAVCWIIFAVLWFRDTEVRISFVIVTTALPTFFYQSRDAVRGIPRDLVDMVRALRPTFGQLLRILVIPAVLPSLLTVWRINIGNATRVTIMAELLGGISGIGHQLRLAQELFRMDQVIVWTAVLVVFVIASNAILSAIESWLLRWRTSDGVQHG